jgi:hypothetical protein
MLLISFGISADLPETTVNIEINTSDSNDYCLASEITTEDIF